MKYKICCCLLAFLSCCMLAAQTLRSDKRVLDYAESAAVQVNLRELGSTDPEKAVKAYFTAHAAIKWKQLTNREFSKFQLMDFFKGSVMMQGYFAKGSSVFAYYNPWWDTILLAEGYSEKTAVDGKLVEILKVSEFAFLCGEIFRGEKVASPVPSAGIYGNSTRPYAVQLMKLFRDTERKFAAVYMTRKPVLLELYPDSRSAENLKAIQIRSAIRLKMFSNLYHNKKRFKESLGLSRLLGTGSQKELELFFRTPVSRMMNSSLVKLPPAARRGFICYGYLTDQKNTSKRIYFFINPRAPRLFSVIRLGYGRDANSMQWFDVSNYKDLLDLADQAEKGGAK